MTTFFIFGILKNYEKIQMEFEQMVDALEFKLQPKVFVEYSSTLRARLGSFGLLWSRSSLCPTVILLSPQLGLATIFICWLSSCLQHYSRTALSTAVSSQNSNTLCTNSIQNAQKIVSKTWSNSSSLTISDWEVVLGSPKPDVLNCIHILESSEISNFWWKSLPWLAYNFVSHMIWRDLLSHCLYRIDIGLG